MGNPLRNGYVDPYVGPGLRNGVGNPRRNNLGSGNDIKALLNGLEDCNVIILNDSNDVNNDVGPRGGLGGPVGGGRVLPRGGLYERPLRNGFAGGPLNGRRPCHILRGNERFVV